VSVMRNRESLLSQEYVRHAFSYDPDSGELLWRNPTSNRVKAGSIVGHVIRRGYRQVHLSIGSFLVHRIIWLYMTGELPTNRIDHRDGDTANNRWLNLREATPAQNRFNSKMPSTNKSGTKGIHWHASSKRWVAQLVVHGRTIRVGSFVDLEPARIAIANAKRKYHGEFARAA
jgi:hypothetical protein